LGKYYKLFHVIVIMNITKQQIEQIENFCLEFYKKLDFAHNVEHMNRTVNIAEFIAKKEGANPEIVRLGAMVHQFHDNVNMLREFLNKIDLDPVVINKLIECTEFRPFKDNSKKNASLEAKVVFDADALQVLGPKGIIREITLNMKARNKPLNQSVQDSREVERKFYQSLQTETAKKLIEKPHLLMKEFWKIYERALF